VSGYAAGMDVDRTAQMVLEGYPWAGRLRRGAPAVSTRVLGRGAAVVGGPEGVHRFYDPRLRRRRAFPPPVKLVLFGPGTVHGLDDEEHHVRKAVLLGVLDVPAVRALAERAEEQWRDAVAGWASRGPVVLFDEAVQVLGQSVLPWAGVPDDGDLPERARQLAAVVNGFAKPGPAYARAVLARWQLGRWASGLVRRTREGSLQPPASSALHAAAHARDPAGEPLPEQVAATELLNVVRPTVAVAFFVAFAGKALHEHPEWRRRIADGDDAAAVAFAQEVRRHYPFTPVLAARARRAQDVLGVRVPRGGVVVLDVYGTLHDPAHWEAPDEFRPDRFLAGPVHPDLLVPQGGGDLATGHRCPGEDVVLAMLVVALRVLAGLPLVVPEQDLGYDLSEIPSRPRSGVVLTLPPPTG
jgi:fatty-acid peroxygenase